MSEVFNLFKDTDDEYQDELRLTTTADQELLVCAENTRLYTFVGMTAIEGAALHNSMFNHAFIMTGVTEEQVPKGVFIFEKLQKATYLRIARLAVQESFPMSLNNDGVPHNDLNAYFIQVNGLVEEFASELPNTIPE